MVPASDLLDDAVRVGGPDERFGSAIVLLQVAVDGGLEVDQGVESATLEAAAREGGEECLDSIGPGARGRGEMEGPAPMAGEPSANLGVLVSGIIVEDGV